MSFLKIVDQMRDPYERKARIIPGLLTALPILLPILCIYGSKHPILTSVITLLAGCGAIFALGSVARGLGKSLEEKLILEWGGMPTTVCLRYRDQFLDSFTKQRYRDLIKSKLDISMPTAEEEAANPSQADDIYIGVGRKLRELTRDNKSLLFKENINYGFHRNMAGMKYVGMMTASIGIFYSLVSANVLLFDPFEFHSSHILSPGLAAIITFAVSIALLMAWLFYFNEATIKRIGFVYAERLFECLSKLPAPRKKSSDAKECSL
jgi:hypothetical protein